MCFMYLFRFIDPYRFQSITVNRFLGDVMILMSPLPLRHVVASQVVKEATEAFLFIGAGDAWRALGQQRLSDLSETSGTPGPQNDMTWTERDFLTEQNHPDTAKCIWLFSRFGVPRSPEKGPFLEHGNAGMRYADAEMPRLAGAKCTAEYENLSPLAVWRNLRHDGRLQSERWGITYHVHISP